MSRPIRKVLRVDADGIMRAPPRALSFPVLTSALLEYLAIVANLRRKCQRSPYRYASSEEFVLFNAKPVWARFDAMTVEPMTTKECFQNCWSVSQAEPELRYAEGFALMCGSIPTHHAWLVRPDGRVEDPTWPVVYQAHADSQPQRDWSGRCVYLGISIGQEAHRRWVGRNSLYPLLLAVHDNDIVEVLELGMEAFR